MKILIFLLITLAPQAFALEAVVTVLESPLLSEPRLDSQVVQYLRKGQVIKVHPSVHNSTAYDHMAPDPKKFQEISKPSEDPLFKGEQVEASLEDEFIPTLDRQGNKVYVIRQHLYFYFNDRKELEQNISHQDPTDYRLEESLPKNYPIFSTSGYRGLVAVGFTQPYTESYPYLSNVKAKGYRAPMDFNFTYLRQAPDDRADRFYIGASLGIRMFTNTYSLFKNVEAQEEGIKISLGPTASYDAYKGVKNRLNFYGTIQVNFFNQMSISQSQGSIEESRNYRAINLTPRLGLQYHRKSVLEDIDFVLGTFYEIEPATTYRSNSAANQGTWWRSRGSDKFRTRASFSLAGYIGFQTAY
jgi:hypothetical protein